MAYIGPDGTIRQRKPALATLWRSLYGIINAVYLFAVSLVSLGDPPRPARRPEESTRNRWSGNHTNPRIRGLRDGPGAGDSCNAPAMGG
ncbi:uncharacterized protein BJ171DRAFT_566423 [Polychytrium aggregatum]|uniref:uncharacterized protein n=1 Tax=Polychytrium aggregatum TaxID=110093 RepID=UPI0022FEFE21|nr:uncharacterized protein BJ171DRAFT_566423 [Polychytrium aggregatum]KAI9207091.1 hypothetical protein BJ171DRAFT_566423 [Polychytrium aggregatum]